MNKANKTPEGSIIDVSKSPPGFMPQIYFVIFSVESIRGFNSTFEAICSATSCPFAFTSISKQPHIYILKIIVIILMNQDEKVPLIWLDKDGALSIYSEFMRIHHDINITVKRTSGYSSYLNG